MRVQAGGLGLREDLAMPFSRLRGEVDVVNVLGRAPYRLAHPLRPFDEEAPMFDPRLPAGQARHPAHPDGAGTAHQRIRVEERGCHGPQPTAGSQALARPARNRRRLLVWEAAPPRCDRTRPSGRARGVRLGGR